MCVCVANVQNEMGRAHAEENELCENTVGMQLDIQLSKMQTNDSLPFSFSTSYLSRMII